MGNSSVSSAVDVGTCRVPRALVTVLVKRGEEEQLCLCDGLFVEAERFGCESERQGKHSCCAGQDRTSQANKCERPSWRPTHQLPYLNRPTRRHPTPLPDPT